MQRGHAHLRVWAWWGRGGVWGGELWGVWGGGEGRGAERRGEGKRGRARGGRGGREGEKRARATRRWGGGREAEQSAHRRRSLSDAVQLPSHCSLQALFCVAAASQRQPPLAVARDEVVARGIAVKGWTEGGEGACVHACVRAHEGAGAPSWGRQGHAPAPSHPLRPLPPPHTPTHKPTRTQPTRARGWPPFAAAAAGRG